jgi:hypothetical protein
VSSSLEQVVRPFQDGQVSPPQQYFQQGQVGIPPVILRFGRGGVGKVLNGSINVTITSYCTAYINEKQSADFGTQF